VESLTVTMERKQALSTAQPHRYTGLRAAAESLSLRNVDAATCELMNEALGRLVMLAYEQDAGTFCNVDSATGKLLIPLPWGSNGGHRWGLRPSESNTLRRILMDWQHPGPSLLQYDRQRRAWHVNLSAYANYHMAKGWLRKHQVTIGVLRTARAKLVSGA
jgi:hypothetical protein